MDARLSRHITRDAITAKSAGMTKKATTIINSIFQMYQDGNHVGQPIGGSYEVMRTDGQSFSGFTRSI